MWFQRIHFSNALVFFFSTFFFFTLFTLNYPTMIMASTSTLSESLYVTQIRFCRALAVVRSLPTESGGAFQPSIADRLNFYGLYKQALNGDCMVLKPSSKMIVAYAKWYVVCIVQGHHRMNDKHSAFNRKAWDKMKGTPPIDAQIMYINALVELLKEVHYTIRKPLGKRSALLPSFWIDFPIQNWQKA